MITVAILINGKPVLTRSAVRIRDNMGFGGKSSQYKLDDGSYILHDPDDGSVELAKKMLDKIDKNFLELKV